MDWLRTVKYWILYPWYAYKEKQRVKAKLEELKKRDPFIYK